MGGYAVQPDGGEEESEQAEQRREARDQPLLDEAIVDLLLERLELHDREVGVDAREGVADDRFETGDRMGDLNHHGPGIHGLVLFRRIVGTWNAGRLCEWQKV